MLLNSCRRAPVLFDIGRHRGRLNILQAAKDRALAPIQELADGRIISDSRVLVTDGNRKKFEVSLGRFGPISAMNAESWNFLKI
jgi:hypothetical protein